MNNDDDDALHEEKSSQWLWSLSVESRYSLRSRYIRNIMRKKIVKESGGNGKAATTLFTTMAIGKKGMSCQPSHHRSTHSHVHSRRRRYICRKIWLRFGYNTHVSQLYTTNVIMDGECIILSERITSMCFYNAGIKTIVTSQ